MNELLFKADLWNYQHLILKRCQENVPSNNSKSNWCWHMFISLSKVFSLKIFHLQNESWCVWSYKQKSLKHNSNDKCVIIPKSFCSIFVCAWMTLQHQNCVLHLFNYRRCHCWIWIISDMMSQNWMCYIHVTRGRFRTIL